MKKWLLVVVNTSTGESKTLNECVYAESKDKAVDKFQSRIDSLFHGKYANGWTVDASAA